MARGKLLNTKTYWMIPGEVGPDKKPVRYSQAPPPQSKGFLGTGGSVEPVQYQEDLYENGDTVVSRYDPQQKDWVQEDVQTDTARATSYNQQIDNARADRPKEPPAQTPAAARIEAANATVAEANATKAANPPTITRPSAGGGTEQVSKDQADYDRQVAGDQRQAAQDLQARLQAAEANARAQARARIEQEKWTAEQANTEYNRSLDKIRLEAQAEVNALTRRSQDITVRGQDLSAGVAQRGQDLSFQGGLVSNAADLQKALIPGFAQPEQWQAIRRGINDTRAIGGQAPLPDFRGGPPPYDPTQFTQQAARMALQQTPSPYTLPGAPARVPPGQYQLPG